MCYLKNLEKEQQQFDFDDFFAKGQEPPNDRSDEQEDNVLIPCTEKQFTINWTQEQQKLVNLFELIDKNNKMISSLNKIFLQNSEIVEKSSIQNESSQQTQLFQASPSPNLAESHEREGVAGCPLTQKLFGCKKYKYSIRLVGEFPQLLYKERNFNLNVQLVDMNGKLVRNGNLLNLCFGMCTGEGTWIDKNRVGEPFLKGKTEVQLYNGQASFMKLYARDVSRSYDGGKVNAVVYPKPSALVYLNSGSYEKAIDIEDIEPLVISEILIKAKKKD